MLSTIAAYTTLAPTYPGYINVSQEEDGTVVLTLRSDPTVVATGIYICGYARDKGAPGRCTPGDDKCNNYCNLAPEKGPMVDIAAPCIQTYEGHLATMRLTPEEWTAFLLTLEK